MAMAFMKVSSPGDAILSSASCRCIFQVTLAASSIRDWAQHLVLGWCQCWSCRLNHWLF